MDKFLEKMDRMDAMYGKEEDMPPEFFEVLKKLRTRLPQAKEKFGKGIILPGEFE